MVVLLLEFSESKHKQARLCKLSLIHQLKRQAMVKSRESKFIEYDVGMKNK